MGRYSFSPRESVQVSETSWRKHDDSESSSNDDDESSIDSDSCSSDEEDYPHPLGFPTYGKTRFFLDPPVESSQLVRRRLGFLTQQDDFLDNEFQHHDAMQSFPPLSSYTDAKTAPTKALLSYSHYDHEPVEEEEEDLLLDGVTQLLKAARIQEDDRPEHHARLLSERQQVAQQLLEMSRSTQHDLASARRDVNLRRQQLEKEHEETHAAFLLLLKQDQQAADKVLKQQEAEARAKEEAEQLRRDQEEKEQAERQRIADARQKKEQAKQQKAVEAAQQRDKQQKAAAQEEAKKTEYVTKARKLVAKLVELRASVAPFEKSKNVSRRRLKMKKAVKGKVNTLSQDAHKIQTVANEVTQSVLEAKAEDDQLKQQIMAGNRDISEEMIRGKRYLVDLLASDTMVRAQAEGFNGTRGDGFPLANMLAIVSTQVKELVPILAAHIYTVCPTAIPILPKVTKNESEQELMESLGMAKGKDGEYETFDRFLARTEGIISLVADIMASSPAEHTLLGGQKGALDWLERFLGHLPEAPETMPLLTAPVLDAFLTGAGHMLANKYPEEFKKHLDVVMNDVVKRLDEGPVGAPSALRLKKLVKGGFDSFKIDFPSKAIPSLYNGGASGGPVTTSGFGQSTTAAQASSSLPPPAPSPFGGGQQQGASSGPFASAGSGSNVAPNPFGGPSSSSGSTPFGGSGGVASSTTPSAQTPFGASAPAPTPFGQQSSSATQATGSFGGGAFGQQGPSTTTPFGQPSSSTSSAGFGGQNQASSSPSPFGQQSSASPFGSQNQSNTMQSSTGASPFGQQGQSGGSGFGGQSQAMGMDTKSPFGAVSNPFGAPSGQSNTAGAFGTSTTPFGGSNQQNTPFGASTQQTTPFGGSTQQTTPFGAQQNTPFGGSNQQNAPFGTGSSQQNTPFGAGSSQQNTPFGAAGGTQNTPFGGQSTPFGGKQNAPFASPFGGGGQQQGGGAFGGGGNNRNAGGNKPPCKFFAQGKCRFGNNCRFSHEQPQGGGGGGFNNNPFGGPRR